jgi:DNA repair photolyase
MPQKIARVVDVRTSRISDRISAINDFVDAGYEVHLNFSPVIYYEGWEDDYRALFAEIDNVVSPDAKAQLKAEVIFLTHNEQLHDVNMRWHPKAEEWLWRPDLQEAKVTTAGGDAVRYRHGWKGQLVGSFRRMMAKHLPYCTIRYAF